MGAGTAGESQSAMQMQSQKSAEARAGGETGGGVRASEAEEAGRMRQEQEEMLRTKERLTGEEQPERQARGERPGEQGEEISKEQSAEEQKFEEMQEQIQAEEEEEEMAMRLQSERQKSQQAVQPAEQAEEMLEAEEQMQKTQKAIQTNTRGMLEGSTLATSASYFSIIILIIMLNVQMLNKYFFVPLFFPDMKDRLAGKPFFDQSLPEDVATIFIDIVMSCGMTCLNPCCCPFFMLIMLIVGVMAAKNEIPGLDIFAEIAKYLVE